MAGASGAGGEGRGRGRPGARRVHARELLGVFALGAGLALIALARLLPIATERVPGSPDVLLVLSLLRWGAESLGSWDAFWSPPFFFPTEGVRTYADHFAGHLLVFAPLARLAGDALGYNLLLWLSFPVAAVCVHVLLRRVGAGRGVAAALALAWAFAPYRWDQIGRLQMLWVPGIPLALVAFDRLLERPVPRRAVAFVAAYALAVSAGSYLAYWLHIPLAALAIARLARTPARLATTRARRALAGAVLGALLLAGLSFGPYLAAASDGELARAEREVRTLGAEVRSWLAPSPRNLYAGLVPAEWMRYERALFPGFLLAGAAAAGALALVRGRRRRARSLELALFASAAAFVALAFAPVWLAVRELLPGMSSMRGPTRTYSYVLLAVALLGARGLGRIAARLGRRRALGAGGVAAALLLLVEVWPLRFETWETPAVDSRARHRPYVGVLAGLERARAVAVLPLTGDHREARRMQPATVHGVPIVNGYSGFTAPSYRRAVARCGVDRLPVSAGCLGLLARLGVSHVVVEAAPGAARVEDVLEPAAAARARTLFQRHRTFVFELRPARRRPERLSARPRS